MHNGFVHDGDRGIGTAGTSGGYGENGVGISLYGPSINLVRVCLLHLFHILRNRH